MSTTSRLILAALAMTASAATGQQLTNEQRSANAKVEKEEAEAAVAKANARKADLEANAAGRVTSGITGSVDLEEGAGTSESALLAAVALNRAAGAIAKRVGSNRRVLIFPGQDAPDLAAAQLFEIRRQEVLWAFSPAGDLFIANSGGAGQLSLGVVIPQGLSPAFAGTLATVNAVASFLKTDWKAGGMSVSQDDYMLAVAVAGKLTCPARIANQLIDPGAVRLIAWQLDALAQEASKGRERRDELSAAIERRPATDPDLPKLRALLAKYDHAFALYAAFLKDVGLDKLANTGGTPAAPGQSGGGGGGTQQIAAAGAGQGGGQATTPTPAPPLPPATGVKISLEAVLPQASIAIALKNAKYALFLRVHSSAGSFYTEKNLWSTLGLNMPFHVSGASVVSYSLVSHETGDVEAAGLLPAPTDYYNARTMAARLEGRRSYRRIAASAPLTLEGEPARSTCGATQAVSTFRLAPEPY